MMKEDDESTSGRVLVQRSTRTERLVCQGRCLCVAGGCQGIFPQTVPSGWRLYTENADVGGRQIRAPETDTFGMQPVTA